MSNMLFIDACFGRKTAHTPVWFMRQAGRYLTEYKQTRKQAKDFIALCKNPALASEVTLQPIEILNVDAAILFSDILVIPLEMGLGLEFIESVGPRFKRTIRNKQDLSALQTNAHNRTGYVYDTIKIVRDKLPENKALIGFCGAPWTLATYMVEGESSKQFSTIKKMLYSEPDTLKTLLSILSEELKAYLESQIKAGANALMIFDSWAGALNLPAYLKFGWTFICDITQFLRKKYPQIPLIVFPKGVGGYIEHLSGDFSVFGIDWGTPIARARDTVGKKFVLQGNLEPATLYNIDTAKREASEILQTMKNEAFVFNLGHGMLPDLPRENAIELVKFIHEKSY